jgi:LysR family transcriptional regulator, cyn operon transcriptional activator
VELRQLRSFLAIAQSGHLTRAANTLNLSQPALSQQIRQLEVELGTALFDRIGRGIRLTAAGEVFRSHARRILDEVDLAQKSIGELDGLGRGTLTVGAVQTVNTYLIPGVVSTFNTRHPGVSVRVEELAADGVERGVLEGRLGLGFTFVPARLDGLAAEKLFEEELVLVASRKHRLAGRRRIDVASLAGEPLILLPETFCTRRLIEHTFASAKVRPRVAVEMNSIDGILRTVATAAGATIVPELAATTARRRDLAVIRLMRPTPRRTVGIIRLAAAHRSAAATRFGEMAREQISERS